MIAPKVRGGATPQPHGNTAASTADREAILFPYSFRFLFLGGLGKKTTFIFKKGFLGLEPGSARSPIALGFWRRYEGLRRFGDRIRRRQDAPDREPVYTVTLLYLPEWIARIVPLAWVIVQSF
jgi:hypothetical protein